MNIQTLLKSKTRHRDDIDFKGIKKYGRRVCIGVRLAGWYFTATLW